MVWMLRLLCALMSDNQLQKSVARVLSSDYLKALFQVFFRCFNQNVFRLFVIVDVSTCREDRRSQLNRTKAANIRARAASPTELRLKFTETERRREEGGGGEKRGKHPLFGFDDRPARASPPAWHQELLRLRSLRA